MIYQMLAEHEAAGKPVALCTITRTRGSTPRRVGSKMLVHPDGRITGTIGGGEMEARVIEIAQEALVDGVPRNLAYTMTDPQRGDPGVCGGQLEIYIEPIVPPPVLLVVGGGHVGRAVAHLGGWLGFRVIVSDDRPEFCTPENIPGGEAYYPLPLAELPEHIEITAQTYIVLTTRNVKVDVAGLPALLDTPAAYLGVIGSRRRWATTRSQLLETGLTEAQLAHISSPVGLELNAETPEEIAISILAEIVMLKRGGNGARMGAE